MNILAHLYLSKTTNEIMVGNFIGDAIKGNQYKNYPKTVQEGILLHRKIDYTTDQHPITIETKKIFKNSYDKYSGVLVDLVFDYYLIRNWDRYNTISFDQYIENVYAYLYKKIWLMPPKMQRITPYIIQNNWLKQYQSIQGINRVLNGMATYTSMPEKATEGILTIKNNDTLLETNFLNFFEDLKQSINF